MAVPESPSLRTGNDRFATSLALLALRLVLGWTFVFHGSQLLFGAFGGKGQLDQLIKGLADMPLLPATAWGYMAACGEFFGGLFVLLGLLTRLAALPIIVTMCVAIAKVHSPNGFSMGSGGYEYNVNLIAMSVALLLAGPGLVSLDALIFKRSLWARGPQPLGTPETRTL